MLKHVPGNSCLQNRWRVGSSSPPPPPTLLSRLHPRALHRNFNGGSSRTAVILCVPRVKANSKCKSSKLWISVSERAQSISMDPSEHLYSRFPGTHPELFLRTIFEEPHLAARVKRVVWTKECEANIHSCGDVNNRIIEELEILALPGTDTLIRSLKRLNLDTSCGAKLWGSEEIETFLLFFHNVQEVKIESCQDWEFSSPSQWWNTLAHVACNTELFANLRSVELTGVTGLRYLKNLSTVPSLRNIDLHEVEMFQREAKEFVSGAGINERWWPPTPTESFVENITMKKSDVYGAFLALFVTLFKHLRTFKYEGTRNDMAFRFRDEDEAIVHPRLFDLGDRALPPLLETLDIQGGSPGMFDTATLTTLLPWEGATNLRHLRVGELALDMFFSRGHQSWKPEEFVSRLPDSLETLCLYVKTEQEYRHPATWWGDKEITALLRILYNTARPRLANLKEVSLVGWSPVLGMYPSAFGEIHCGFAAAGIRFVSIPTDWSRHLVPMSYDNVEPDWVFVKIWE
ncbi:hypothetical protein IQ07DRAFT_681828 [Pyrenochaeta sp. DS3sAY3a]|nr:hypothetical protein IQ07DRAFT_681828 [Pyrenochaeta sp. DS3sAY3a]